CHHPGALRGGKSRRAWSGLRCWPRRGRRAAGLRAHTRQPSGSLAGQARIRPQWMGRRPVSARHRHRRVRVMTMPPATRRFVIGITGASGALYATRTMAALLERGCHLDVIASDYGRRLLIEELGAEARVDRLQDFLADRHGDGVRSGALQLHSNRDLGSALASGGNRSEAMVVVPCSMKTLAGIAHGLSQNLIERAADVMLKERRRLIVV